MATNEELQEQLEVLRDQVQRLLVQVVPAEEAQPVRVLSRRNLLRAAPIAAIGGAVAAMSATPAAAAVGDPVLIGHSNVGTGSTTSLTGGTPNDAGGPVSQSSTPALAVTGGISGDWLELDGASIGIANGAILTVQGSFENGDAAHFSGPALPVLHGEAGGDAVLIDTMGDGTALTVTVTDGSFDNPQGPATVAPGVGIAVTSLTGNAITATSEQTAVAIESTSTSTSSDAVTIDYAGTSRAFYAQSHNGTNINGTVTGVNEGHGIGVWGEQRNNSGTGFGVVGVGGALGRGARLSGGAAALQILPSSAATHPTTGKAGDVFVDASVRLWFCTKASSGAVAAVWKQIA